MMIRRLVVCAFWVLMAHQPLMAQEELPRLQISLQTDLLAYTTAGGWSAWASAQLDRHKLSVAYVKYPNRFQAIYDETGIQENPSWLRIQLSREFKPDARLRNFFYGINVEHHWRELVEDGNPEEILHDTHWQAGAFAGYDWAPWRKKDNALRNISVILWGGLNVIPDNVNMSRVFENTGNIYPIPGAFRSTLGVNLSYTIFQR